MGDYPSDGFAWSPDSHYIAYVGHPNENTAQHWMPDVRVVELSSGDSVTIYADLRTVGRPQMLIWLKSE
jgi:uncharacterized Zn ribbon protein